MKILVQYDNYEKAIRKLKKKMADSNKLQEVRDRGFYEKPTTAKKKKRAAAKARWNNHLRSQSLPKKMF